MKKILFIMALIISGMGLNAQEPQYVSKEQQKRNVLIEEFTGINCPNCPRGHRIANEIADLNPGRVWSVNIHDGGYAPDAYPNLKTTDGAGLASGFAIGGYPCGAINREGGTNVVYTNEWAAKAKEQLEQDAEVNIAGKAVINPATRTATIKVEAYYTKDSGAEKNYLTIMMLQDSILGPQSGASSNPAQVVGNDYCHMHILRDVVTTTWGEEISPATSGSFISEEFSYVIPEIVGSPNGVEVNLDHITFIAFITKAKAPVTTCPVLNVCELEKIVGVEEPIYPFIKSVKQEEKVTCSPEKKFIANIVNAGTTAITSMKFEAVVRNGETTTQEWTGNIPVFGNENIDLFAEIPNGRAFVTFKIIEANGEKFLTEEAIEAKSEEWIQVEIGDTAETEEFKLELAHDRFGNQISWQAISNNSGELLAKGGLYEMLNSPTTKVVEESITIPAGECFTFIIEDNIGNGMAGNYGKGYYKIYDSKGNIIVDADGDFGHSRQHLIFVHGAMSVEDVEESLYNVYPNPVSDVLTVSGADMRQINVFNSVGQLVKSVNCNEENVQINVSDLNSGMYFVNVINKSGEMTTSKVSVVK